jgi:broad specificity phosphatase PhoE
MRPAAMATMAAMGTLYLVRHGQASFGADDYDQLSELGQRQSLRLGQYLHDRHPPLDAVIMGSLRRHAQTWDGIWRGLGQPALEPLVWPGLNEYDSAAVIAAIHPQPLDKPDTPEKYRHHFRLLRDGLAQWMAGTVSPRGMPSYTEFVDGVRGALELVRREHVGRRVLIVSSGGPIATAVGQVLGTTPETTIDLNMRIRNSALSELSFSARRHTLITYNTLPHLDDPAYRDWVTYA